MRLPILWLVGMGVGFFPVVFPATTLLDFIVFCGARPERQLVSVGRMLNESDLGVEITRVKFKIVWNGSRSGKQPDRRPDDAFALSLDVGSPIFEVKSCSPWFRLAARQEG